MRIHHYHSLIFFLLILILVVVGSVVQRSFIDEDGMSNTNRQNTRLLYTEVFFNEELFVKGEIDKESWIIERDIKGAVIPHHGLAAKYLSSFFSAIKDKEITTVILMGPNHDRVGDKMIYTSKASWKTEFGVLQSDMDIIENLSRHEEIKINDEIVANDHSIGTIMPYIAKYMPAIKVVPLLVNEADMISIKNAVQMIIPQVGDSVLVIAAVDFSHDLNANEAVLKDAETLSVIKNKEHQRLLGMGNNHLDAPTTIVLLAKTMEKIGYSEFTVLKMSNSYEITGNPSQVTSYMVGIY